MGVSPVDKALEVYTLSEILELSDVTEEEVLSFLLQEGIVKLHDPESLSFDDEASYN